MENSLSFKLNLGSAEKSQISFRDFPGPNEYIEFWGDEFNWTALLPFAWKNIATKNIAIRPARSGDLHAQAAYWTAAVHLLGLGLGWTNIGEGLRTWRRYSYRMDQHPILDYILRHYGENIFALERYFGAKPRYEIFGTLSQMSDRSIKLSPEVDNIEGLYSMEMQEGYFESLSGSEKTLALALLNGGTDPLHLEPHVSGSFALRKSDTGYSEVRKLSSTEFSIEFKHYAGWAQEMNRRIEIEPAKGSGFSEDQKVHVFISGIGLLGTFIYHSGTGRWFMYSEDFGAPSLQWDTHSWGN